MQKYFVKAPLLLYNHMVASFYEFKRTKLKLPNRHKIDEISGCVSKKGAYCMTFIKRTLFTPTWVWEQMGTEMSSVSCFRFPLFPLMAANSPYTLFVVGRKNTTVNFFIQEKNKLHVVYGVFVFPFFIGGPDWLQCLKTEELPWTFHCINLAFFLIKKVSFIPLVLVRYVINATFQYSWVDRSSFNLYLVKRQIVNSELSLAGVLGVL